MIQQCQMTAPCKHKRGWRQRILNEKGNNICFPWGVSADPSFILWFPDNHLMIKETMNLSFFPFLVS